MKYITLIIALVIGSYCYGQKKDSVVSVIKGDATPTDFIIIGGSGGVTKPGTIIFHPYDTTTMTDLKILSKQDTIRVLMLVCDTTQYPKDTRLYFRQSDQMIHDGKLVWWQYGYEVYEMNWGSVPCENPQLARNCFGWYQSKFNGYFDQNKKPLPKSIVVWITKEIK